MRIGPSISPLVVLGTIVLGACGAPTASEPASGSSATTPSPPSATAVVSPSSFASAQATPTEPELEVQAYPVGTFLEVVAGGLGVRSGPGIDHPLVAEFLLHQDPVSVEKLRDAVRLPAGHVVRVDLGPLVVGNRAWYAVHNVAQDGQAAAGVPSWGSRAPGPGDYFELAWLAVAEPGEFFVQPTDRPAMVCPCYGDGPAPVAVATGVGDGRVGPWNNDRVAFIQIAASSISEGETCDFWVSGSDGDPPLISEQAMDSYQTLLRSIDVAPGMDEASLRVSGDCAWAMKVDLVQ